MQKEIWKDIKGFEGHYLVSSFGNIKSIKFCKEKILKPGTSKNGYLHVVLLKHKKRLTITVHKIVAIAFHGHKPDITKGLVVDHKDHNKLNNHKDNLQIITARKNLSKDQFRRNNTSKYVGVTLNKRDNNWCAYISIDGKRKHLGYFKEEISASKAYQNALKNIL